MKKITFYLVVIFLTGLIQTSQAQSHTFATFSPGTITGGSPGIATTMTTTGLTGDYLFFEVSADYVSGGAWSNSMRMEMSDGGAAIYNSQITASSGTFENTSSTTLYWTGVLERKYVGGGNLTVEFIDTFLGGGSLTSTLTNVVITIGQPSMANTFATFSPGTITGGSPGVSTTMTTTGLTGDYLFFEISGDYVSSGGAWSNSMRMEMSNGGGVIYNSPITASSGTFENTSSTTLYWTGVLERKYVGGGNLTVRFVDNFSTGGPFSSTLTNVVITMSQPSMANTFATFSPGTITGGSPGVSTTMTTTGLTGDYLFFEISGDYVSTGGAWSNSMRMEMSNGGGVIYNSPITASSGTFENTSSTTLYWTGVLERKYIGGGNLTVRFVDNFSTGGPFSSTLTNVMVTIGQTASASATFTAPADLCIDAGVQSGLGGGTPIGGVYSGPGVTDDGNGMTYSFNPATAGAGTHTITYTESGNSATDDVEVFALPVVAFTAPADLCLNAGVQNNLGGGTPTGGVYSGPGVTDDGNGMTYDFDPAAAGVGTHTITYNYTDANGCSGSASDNIEVFALPTVAFTAPADLCIDAGVQAGLSGGAPTGGVYSGPGVTDDGNGMTYSFDPAAAGAGIHTLTYTFTDANGCSGSASDMIEVFALPALNYTAPADLCLDAGVQAGLGGGSPMGGVYSGTGVTDDGNGMTYSFDPAAAGVGTHTLTYTFADANGCTNSASDDVEVFALPVVAFTAPADLCLNAGVQAGLGGGTPTGGVYSGTGVTDDGNGMTYSFDPAAAGVGTHTITYNYTDANGCSGSASDDVEVFALPTVTFTAPADLCIDAGVQAGLGGGTPTGGVYSGPGVTDDGNGMTYSFDPAAAGAGIHTLTYTFVDTNGCAGSATDMVEVFALPVVAFTAPADLCLDAGVQAGLGGGAPMGGVYSGTGVTDDGNGMTYSFDPAAAGVGTHTITYAFADTNGCTNSASDDVEVFALPIVAFTALADLCLNAGEQTDVGGGSPVGGIFSGPGVTDNMNGMTYDFDPTAAGIGVHTITFDYTDGNGCSASASDDVEVFDLPLVTVMAPADLCIDAGVQTGLGGGTPPQGTVSGDMGAYSGSGVTDDGNGMTYSFNPATAGVGIHTITYTYTNDNGCTWSDSDNVEVFALPIVVFTAPADLCIDAGVQAGLGGGTPPQGTVSGDLGVYSGPGVTDDGNGMTYSFDPAAAGVGTHTITYTYTDDNGCSASASDTIEVFALPVVTFTAPAGPIYANDPILPGLSGGFPIGGIYSGPGVFDDGNGLTYSFDPALAGIGTWTLTYTWTNVNGCTNSASDTVVVLDPATVEIIGGDLVFTDINDLDDTITIVIEAPNYRLTDASGNLFAGIGIIQDGNDVLVPIAAITGNIQINTENGNDSFTVDLSGGNFGVDVLYNGGPQTASPGDVLGLTGGGTFTSVEHTFVNENDGNVAITGNNLISYTGLEPITDNVSALDRIFTFIGGTETIVLDASGTLDNRIDSSLGEVVDFTNPTNSLTLNAGTGNDIVSVEGVDAAFDADLTINGNTGEDTVRFINNATALGNGNLMVSSERTDFDVATSTLTTGSITINSSIRTRVLSGAVISAVDGNISVTGNAGGSPVGAFNSDGIIVTQGSTIRTTGSGNITLDGVGTSNGAGNGHIGVLAQQGSVIESTGTGAISLTGTGGSGVNANTGIDITGTSIVRSNNGNIDFTGNGGAGSGNNNRGIRIIQNSQVTSTGTGAITVVGAGGTGLNNNFGVEGNNAIVTAGSGAISITGVAGGTGANNRGVHFINTNGLIESNGGGVSINGTGAGGTGNANFGVEIANTIGVRDLGTGDISIVGIGGTGTAGNRGVNVFNAAITSNGGNLTINGTGGNGTGNNHLGVNLQSTSMVNTNGAGTITIVGTSGIGGNLNIGVSMFTGSTVSSEDGTISITGNGLDPTGNQIPGIELAGGSSIISTQNALIQLFGSGSNANGHDISISGNTTLIQTGGDVTLNAINNERIGTPTGIPAANLIDANTITINGFLRPGFGNRGQLAVAGNTLFAGDDTVQFNIADFINAGTDYDQLAITGTVDISGATLELVDDFGPAEDSCDTLILIDNDGTDAIIGTFVGVAEGDSVVFGGITGKVSYVGGDGNDFVLTLDDTAPIAVCQDITIQLDINGDATIVAGDVDGGSTDNCGIASIAIDIDTFDCSDVGTNTVTLTVTDVNGNVSTCTAAVTVEDNIPPAFFCPADIIAGTNNGDCGATVTFPLPVAFDNCGIDFIVQQAGVASGEVFPIGLTTNQFLVVDVNGNVSTCSFTVTVVDVTAPMAICQDITVMLDAAGTATITPADVDGGSSDNCNIDTISIDIDTFTCADLGDNVVTLTVTDTAGLTSTCTAIVTVENGVMPNAVCQDATVQLDAFGMATITDASIFDGGSTDACGTTSLTFSVSPDTFGCADVGDNTVTITVTDDGGNTSTCTATVTVEDVIDPTVSCMDLTVSLDENGEASINPEDLVVMSDDVCGIATTSADITDFTCDDIGTPVLVTVTVEDPSGNMASCTATITVLDELAPELECPVDLTVQTVEGTQYEVEDFIATGIATATDNCVDPVIVVNQSPAIGDLLDPGVYPVTITVADDSGNEAECTFDLTVEEVLGVGDISFDISTLKMFPNPATDFVMLSNPQSIPLNDVSIYDVTGRLIKTLDASQVVSEMSIDISELASASYMFIINTDNGQVAHQIVKE